MHLEDKKKTAWVLFSNTTVGAQKRADCIGRLATQLRGLPPEKSTWTPIEMVDSRFNTGRGGVGKPIQSYLLYVLVKFLP